ncbi:hypothetical protein IPM19_02800 [bacterium]|nr:MAG: hypothetical protein IPM19_02800 [bacterium]
MGNYENDQVLVEAWMNSPGHRANILDSKFNEIGVAVGRGMFEGKEVWLAVQEFGAPMSNCPTPSVSLKSQIDRNRETIEEQEAQLSVLRAQIQANRYKTRAEYEAAVAEHNTRAEQLNVLIDKTKTIVNEYNQQVNSFNSCLEKNG